MQGLKGGKDNKSRSHIAEFIWQDREIRFDVDVGQLQCRAGEKIIDQISEVEDTKGNNGERGNLLITNLRLIWFSEVNKKVNLSVGFDCILNTEIKETFSAIKGNTLALYLRTSFIEARYEFIFSSLVKNSPRLFTSFQAVVRSYESTKLYRDLKLRSAIISDKNLILLPHEEVFSKYSGVMNLSAEQGSLGTFFITNVRLVWFAQLSENFNVSCPWVQLKCIRIRESKYGMALVLETSDFSSNYVLGFQLTKLEECFTEINQLFKTYSVRPFFGVESVYEDIEKNLDEVTIPVQEDKVDIVDTGYEEQTRAQRKIYEIGKKGAAQNAQGEQTNLELNEELGLACEALPQNVTLDQLWRIA